MIFYRTLLDELRRDDQFCYCCGLRLRARMLQAAHEGDRNWIFCQECRGRWTAKPDVNEASRGWVLLLLTGDPIPVAILCAECAANPNWRRCRRSRAWCWSKVAGRFNERVIGRWLGFLL